MLELEILRFISISCIKCVSVCLRCFERLGWVNVKRKPYNVVLEPFNRGAVHELRKRFAGASRLDDFFTYPIMCEGVRKVKNEQLLTKILIFFYGVS